MDDALTASCSALAFVAPSAILSAMMPAPYRWEAIGLLALLCALLIGAALWSATKARATGRDPGHWAFVTVITFGLGMIVLLLPMPRALRADGGIVHVCMECGHRAGGHTMFCHRCGAIG